MAAAASSSMSMDLFGLRLLSSEDSPLLEAELVIHKPEAYLTGLWIMIFAFEASSCSSVAASLCIPANCCGGDDNDDVDDNDTDAATASETEATDDATVDAFEAASEFVSVCCCCRISAAAAAATDEAEAVLPMPGTRELSWAAHVLHGHEAITSRRKHSMVDCF